MAPASGPKSIQCLQQHTRYLTRNLLVGCSLVAIAGLKALWHRLNFYEYHSYAPQALQDVQNDEAFQSVMCSSLGGRIVIDQPRGTLDAKRLFARSEFRLRTKLSPFTATVFVAAKYRLDPRVAQEDHDRFREVHDYQQTGGLDTLKMKPFIIKLMILEKLLQYTKSMRFGSRFKPKIRGDKSKWDVDGIAIRFEKRQSIFGSVFRKFKLIVLPERFVDKEALERADRHRSFIVSLRGAPSVHASLEHQIRPTGKSHVSDSSRRRVRYVLCGTIAVLGLWFRRHFRSPLGENHARRFIMKTLQNQLAIRQNAAKLWPTLPELNFEHSAGPLASPTVLRIQGEASDTYIDAAVHFTVNQPSLSSEQAVAATNAHVLHLVAGRDSLEDEYKVFACSGSCSTGKFEGS